MSEKGRKGYSCDNTIKLSLRYFSGKYITKEGLCEKKSIASNRQSYYFGRTGLNLCDFR